MVIFFRASAYYVIIIHSLDLLWSIYSPFIEHHLNSLIAMLSIAVTKDSRSSYPIIGKGDQGKKKRYNLSMILGIWME